ncbi:hypothetical protein NBZ79_09315 [Sneathiella marina]|uniref:DUF3592 domain-containing protein n=1 Tax=Sneathiella marina TaxID=2950108 RepID=A0ABY4W8D7_9PROT|nr:hypothetical protein [Sneathiella marina]USG63174.1 hypothetical protein NBZ79_09315 [Sneathiella marina]
MSKREAERDYLYMKYFVTMFFFAVACGLVIYAQKDGLKYTLFLVDGDTTMGTVEEFHKFNPRFDFLSYSFTDQYGERHAKTRLVNRNYLSNGEVGGEIEVTFSRRYPDVADPTILVPHLKPAFWLMTVGSAVILLLAISSIFSVLQLVRHRKADRYY